MSEAEPTTGHSDTSSRDSPLTLLLLTGYFQGWGVPSEWSEWETKALGGELGESLGVSSRLAKGDQGRISC